MRYIEGLCARLYLYVQCSVFGMCLVFCARGAVTVKPKRKACEWSTASLLC